MNGYRTRMTLSGLADHRPLFLRAPWHVRLKRWWRARFFGWIS